MSLRSRDNIHVRHARDGFWHFPGEEPWPAPEAVIWAALQTAAALPPDQALALLDDSAIAVTFFTALEACPVGALDNDRYGIVVRSLERPGWMGGALPRMPGILNEWDQYQHARMTNARTGLVRTARHLPPRRDQGGRARRVPGSRPACPPRASGRRSTQATCGGSVAPRARDLALARLFGERAADTAPLRRRPAAGRRRFALCKCLSRRTAARMPSATDAAPARRGCRRHWWSAALGDARFDARTDVASRRRASRSRWRSCTTASSSGFIRSRTSCAACATASRP